MTVDGIQPNHPIRRNHNSDLSRHCSPLMFCLGVEAPQNIYLGSAPLLLNSQSIERFCFINVNVKFVNKVKLRSKKYGYGRILDLSRIVASGLFG
jgi:hypothetical protein